LLVSVISLLFPKRSRAKRRSLQMSVCHLNSASFLQKVIILQR